LTEKPGRGISFNRMMLLVAHYTLIEDEQAMQSVPSLCLSLFFALMTVLSLSHMLTKPSFLVCVLII
jgi:hypothetical protein